MFIGGSPEFVKKKTHRTGGAEFRDRWRTFSEAGSRIPGDHTPGSAPVPRAGKGGARPESPNIQGNCDICSICIFYRRNILNPEVI